jgi:hypothetical protein
VAGYIVAVKGGFVLFTDVWPTHNWFCKVWLFIVCFSFVKSPTGLLGYQYPFLGIF